MQLTDRVFLRLEGDVADPFWRGGNFPDSAPRLLVVWDDELVYARRNHISLNARRIAEQHEGLFALGRRCRIDNRLCRAIVIVDLDKIAGVFICKNG